MTIKGLIAPGSVGDNGTVPCPVFGGGYMNLHVLKFIELYTKRKNSKFFYMII